MFEYFQKGGPVMYFIMLLSVYGLSVFIERLYFFYSISFNYKTFLADIKKMLVEKENDHVLMMLRRTPGPLGSILLQCVNLISSGTSDLKSRINEIGSYEIQRSEGRIKHLAVIGNMTPLLGLLGTVTGMITAFSAISMKGANSPTAVAGGISEALITTAYGLIIAIPSILAYNYLNSKYETVVLETEHAMSDFIDFVEKKDGLK